MNGSVFDIALSLPSAQTFYVTRSHCDTWQAVQ